MKATKPGMLTTVDGTLLKYREDGNPPQSFSVFFYPPSEKNTVTASISATVKAFEIIKNKEYEFVEQCFPHYFPKVMIYHRMLRVTEFFSRTEMAERIQLETGKCTADKTSHHPCSFTTVWSLNDPRWRCWS